MAARAQTYVWLLTAAMALVGVLLWATALRTWPAIAPPAFPLPLWLQVGVFAVAEACVVHMHFQQNTNSFSLAEVPIVLGLALVRPTSLLVALVAACIPVARLQRRQPLMKLCFNVAHWVLETEVAIAVYRAILGHATPYGPRGWGAALAATLTWSICSHLAVTAAIWITARELSTPRMLSFTAFALTATSVTTSTALVTLTLLRDDRQAALLVLFPLAILYVGHRNYLRQRAKQERLDFLYDSAQLLQHAPEWESAVMALLDRARDAFRADIAQLIYDAGDGVNLLETTIGPGDRRVVMANDLAADLRTVWAHVVQASQPLLLHEDRDLAAVLPELGLSDAIAMPLHGQRGRLGTILVGNRRGNVGAFGPADVRPLETLAAQVTVAIEQGRLEHSVHELSELGEQLSRQALHDWLTGLPNRVLFTERLAQALAPDAAGMVAVIFVDLDDFKTVNDRYGHAAGDELLRLVAGRLQHGLRPQDTAARLGGDEFAVLVPGLAQDAEAHGMAQRLLAHLQQPAAIDGRPTTIRASVGVAVCRPGDDGDTLLRNADAAMYQAKQQGKARVVAFTPAQAPLA